jgi:hypothetical protein
MASVARFRSPASSLHSVPRAFLGIALAAFLSALAGCAGDDSVSGPPVYRDDGMWVLDTAFTLDEFNYDSAACAEVFPGGSVNVDAVPANAAAYLRVRSTACYHARVRVINADSDTVRTFETRFAIFNRTEGEKNRAMLGFLAWDGKGDGGAALPAGEYLWRMEFDFGAARIRKFRTVFTLP